MSIQKEIIYTFKIVIIGSGGVGKTAIFNRYCFNSFNINTELTVGINFHSNYLKIKCKDDLEPANKYVVNSIFDFGGQDRFKPLLPKFINGANGAILVFDSISYNSFLQLDYWYDQLIQYSGDPNIPKILVGSKCDLLKEVQKEEIVKDDAITDFINDKKITGFFRTSALENRNILELFKALTKKILNYNELEAILI